jgi:hypothetical protein
MAVGSVKNLRRYYKDRTVPRSIEASPFSFMRPCLFANTARGSIANREPAPPTDRAGMPNPSRLRDSALLSPIRRAIVTP